MNWNTSYQGEFLLEEEVKAEFSELSGRMENSPWIVIHTLLWIWLRCGCRDTVKVTPLKPLLFLWVLIVLEMTLANFDFKKALADWVIHLIHATLTLVNLWHIYKETSFPHFLRVWGMIKSIFGLTVPSSRPRAPKTHGISWMIGILLLFITSLFPSHRSLSEWGDLEFKWMRWLAWGP